MKIQIEAIPIDGHLPVPCDYEICELDASVRVTCDDLTLPDSGNSYERTPLCTGHAHVVFAEAMLGL